VMPCKCWCSVSHMLYQIGWAEVLTLCGRRGVRAGANECQIAALCVLARGLWTAMDPDTVLPNRAHRADRAGAGVNKKKKAAYEKMAEADKNARRNPNVRLAGVCYVVGMCVRG